MTSFPLPYKEEGQRDPLPDRPPVAGQYVSHSQLDHGCGLALKFARERTPWLSRSVALVFGSALHAGLERWMWGRDLQGAIKASHLELMVELGKMPEVKFDGRFKRGKKEAAIRTPEDAERMLEQSLTAWHLAKKDADFQTLATERTVWIKLGRPEGWKIQCRIDAVVSTPKGKEIWDFKTAGKPWDEGKLANASAQANLYMAAETRDTGVSPDHFKFIVFPKGSDGMQELRVEFDPGTINNYLEYIVRPTIRMIEADAFVANTRWWGHSPDFCAYWHHCPLGAAAQAKPVVGDAA